MNYLLDTHVCIWAIGKEAFLSDHIKFILGDNSNDFWLSKISLLEIAIKKKIGKLPDFGSSITDFVTSTEQTGFKILDLKHEHLEAYNQLDFHQTHRDPFDRYLLAAAYSENFVIITKDEKFQLYKSVVKIIW